MNLTYKNLCIRNAGANDAATLCAWWNDGNIMAHAGFPNGTGQTEAQIRKSLAEDDDSIHRRHIIEINGKAAGEMNYRNVGGSTAQIGIKICDASYQNKGYGTTLLSMFIDSLFRHFHYNMIILDTNATNLRAQHVYERKIGFQKVAFRENSWRNQVGELQSSIDYELKKEDFQVICPPYRFYR